MSSGKLPGTRVPSIIKAEDDAGQCAMHCRCVVGSFSVKIISCSIHDELQRAEKIMLPQSIVAIANPKSVAHEKFNTAPDSQLKQLSTQIVGMVIFSNPNCRYGKMNGEVELVCMLVT